MKETWIHNKNNAYQRFEVLQTNRKKRHRYNEFLVEGVRSLNEAVQNGWHIKSFIYDRNNLSDWARNMIKTVPTEENFVLPAALLEELSRKSDSSELLAVIEMREDDVDRVPLSDNPLIVLFDRPSNKGNLGTIIRSCDALAADMLILTGHSVDLYEPDVVVSAMGSFFNLPVVRMTENGPLYNFIDRMKERYPGFLVAGTTAHQEMPIWEAKLDGPILLMVGNETMGLNRAYREKCDLLCSIPMDEKSYASSFNVGCALSNALYEIVRQRKEDGGMV